LFNPYFQEGQILYPEFVLFGGKKMRFVASPDSALIKPTAFTAVPATGRWLISAGWPSRS
jgi:hypothetical protein